MSTNRKMVKYNLTQCFAAIENHGYEKYVQCGRNKIMVKH